MKKSKLIELLQKLDSRERSRFAEYIHSPYFNKNEILRRLCDYLLKLAPDFDNERKLDKERIYAFLFPDKPLDVIAFHRYTSLLLDLLQQFLMQELWDKRKAEQQVLLLEALRQRKATKHYQLIAEGWQTLAATEEKQQGKADAQWLLYRYNRERNAAFIDTGERRYDAHLQAQYNHLNTFFVIEQWRMACDMASRNKVINGKYEYSFLTHLQSFIEKSELKNNYIIYIYQTIFQLFTTDAPNDEPYYFQLKQALAQPAESFADADLLDIYGYLLNYAIRQINRGRKEYYREALEHYRFLVERRLMFIDGYLPAANYKNIVTIALALEEYDWTKNFIEAHRLSLAPDHRENTYSYNLASYYYATGEQGRALQTLHNVDFVDVSYSLGAKIMQLKCYFELDEGEALLALIDTFNSYLRRNKDISEAQKQANFNFLKWCKKIYKWKEAQPRLRKKESEEKRQELAQELQNTSPVANKLWLENVLGQG